MKLVDGYKRPDDLQFPAVPESRPGPIPYPPDAPKLEDAAVYGVMGEFATRVAPYTEAPLIAVLIHALIYAGIAIGRGPYIWKGGDQHTNEFVILSGLTNSGRKGTAAFLARYLMDNADPEFTGYVGGLSTYEGLINQVRDPQNPDETGAVIETSKDGSKKKSQHIDPGVTDKRKVFEETEWAQQLRKMKGETNSLSEGVRKVWDTGNLQNLPQSKPMTATGAHIGIIGHITPDEYRKEMTDIQLSNGLANRFATIYAHRICLMAHPAHPSSLPLKDLIQFLSKALGNARKCTRIELTPEANQFWNGLYYDIETRNARQSGMAASMVARAAPHILRFSLIYALLDNCQEIRVCHLKAAAALWRYAEGSARFIFGNATGNIVADIILKHLRSNPEGMTTVDLTENVFSKNLKPGQFEEATRLLVQADLIKSEKVKPEGGRGRPSVRWTAIDPDDARNNVIAAYEVASINAPEAEEESSISAEGNGTVTESPKTEGWDDSSF